MACGPEPSATAWLREVSMTSAHLANLFPSLARQSNPWKPWDPCNPWNPQHEASLRRTIPCTNGLCTEYILSGGMACPTRPEAAGMPRRRDAVSAVRNETTEAALGSEM